MEKVKLSIHKQPLLPITRFTKHWCDGCWVFGYMYGGYRCNELGCESVFHRECAESLPEINHSLHPDHPLKLRQRDKGSASCSRCGFKFTHHMGFIYICSICDFKLDLRCAKGTGPLLILENSNLHQHPLELFSSMRKSVCKACDSLVHEDESCYGCNMCEFVFHEECGEFFPQANHIFHPQHPLKLLTLAAAPNYADEKCLLCGVKFVARNKKLHHCDVCNFSICKECMKYPPPGGVESLTTHEHRLHLVPRRITFTCNVCGTLGDRSPYFCLQCNFMIHWNCIDLPRVININRHDHRISYTRRLGLGQWKCKVCRKKVDGFYGAYTCVKCPSFAVHSLCATRKDVWDGIELEGTLDEEEEIAPFEVIDDNTIKHFSHDHHNLQRMNNDGHGHNWIQPENLVCEACRLQILLEPFYSCKQCHFILHEKCANYPRKKRHVIDNLPFILLTYSRHEVDKCELCNHLFTGFRYKASYHILDVRCAAISDTLEHESHGHPLYFDSRIKDCSGCGERSRFVFSCDECEYVLCGECAHFPKVVMKNRYDDHPLLLSFGEKNVDGDYWCEACETKVDPKEWFYTCNDCGTVLHISCVVGDFLYIMPGSHLTISNDEVVSNTSNEEVVSSTSDEEVVVSNTSDEEVVSNTSDEEVVSNTSISRPLCSVCNSRCLLPSILKNSKAGVDEYFCSSVCNNRGKCLRYGYEL